MESEVYRQRLGEQGRSDVLGRLEAELGPIDEVRLTQKAT